MPDSDAKHLGTPLVAARVVVARLKLVDRLATSDDYLLSRMAEARVFALKFTAPRPLRERVARTMSSAAERLLVKLWTRADSAKYQ